MLDPTPERIAAARRASGRDWTFGYEGPVELGRDETLAEMVMVGLIKPHYVSGEAQIFGQDDYFRLTDSGREWLARAEQESQR